MPFDFGSIFGGFQEFLQGLLEWISQWLGDILGNLPFLQ